MSLSTKTEPEKITPAAAPEGKTGASSAVLSLEAHLGLIRGLGANAKSLRLVAEQQAVENDALKTALELAKKQQEALRIEFEALCQPEQHPVVITHIERNGSILADVAGAGTSRLRVTVHPRVDPARLRIGARGLLTRSRNCLLQVENSAPEWRDVATFEKYLDDGRRLLLRHQEQFVAVTRSDDLAGVELKKGELVGFDRDAGLAYARVLPADGEHLFTDDVPTDEFADLGGLGPQIAQIKRAIELIYRNPEIAARYHLPRKKGILLFGPPGNGKTRLARCAATHVGRMLGNVSCRFMSIEGASDYSMWFGQTEARFRDRFDAVREAARDGPVVMFFDEIDAIGRRRGTEHGSGAPDRVLNTFLSLLDGVHKLSDVIILAATNRADVLDPSLTRPGRFNLKLEIPAPNRAAARAVLSRYLNHDLPIADKHKADGIAPVIENLLSRIYSPRSDYAELVNVRLSDNRQIPVPARALLSGALLENVVHAAAEEAAVRELQTGATGVTEEDLALSLDQEFRRTAALLTPANVKAYVSAIPAEAHPIAVLPVERPNVALYSHRN